MISFITDNSTFIQIIGSFGGWIGSQIVQHLTGLSLTQPISILGPVGLIGSFGVYQTAFKAVLSPARLRNLGWGRDQTPARGIAEALTTAATQDSVIHYGFPFDRQQTHLIPFDPQHPRDTLELGPNGFHPEQGYAGGQWRNDKKWSSLYIVNHPQIQGAHGVLPSQFAVQAVGANAFVEGVRISSSDNVGPHVYHANITWLGKKKGIFTTCDDTKHFNIMISLHFIMFTVLSISFMAAMIVGEIYLLTGGRPNPIPGQVIFYGTSKAFTLIMINLHFLLQSYVYAPGLKCRAPCHPARLRIYRQRYEGVGSAHCTVVAVFCERSYRMVQGISHPALDSHVGNHLFRLFKYGSFPMKEPVEWATEKDLSMESKYRRRLIWIIDITMVLSTLLFLFSFAWYLAWISTQAHQSKEWKVLFWSGIELVILAAKFLLLGWPKWIADSTGLLKNGRAITLILQSLTGEELPKCSEECPIGGRIRLEVSENDLKSGMLVEFNRYHAILIGCQVKYKYREVFTQIHFQFGSENRHFWPMETTSDDRDQAPYPNDIEPFTMHCTCGHSEIRSTVQFGARYHYASRVKVAPFFYYVENKKIHFLISTTIGIRHIEIGDNDDLYQESSTFNISWSPRTKTCWIGHKTFNDVTDQTFTEIPKMFFQRSVSFAFTTVKTLAGKTLNVVEGHTVLEPQREQEITWLQLNKEPVQYHWRRNTTPEQVIPICFLGAGEVTAALLSDNKQSNTKEAYSCFCNIFTL